jgi:hypothetical protein
VIRDIIILCASFCSDIWYCNILAYYLGNILVYYLDKITLLYKYDPIVIYRTHFVLVFNGCLKISIKKERKMGTKLKNNEPRNIL